MIQSIESVTSVIEYDDTTDEDEEDEENKHNIQLEDIIISTEINKYDSTTDEEEEDTQINTINNTIPNQTAPFPYTSSTSDPECLLNARKCKALRNLIMALDFYINVVHNNSDINNLIMEYFNENDGYKSVLDDYGHIIYHHLNFDSQKSGKQFEMIHTEITKHIQCDILHCEQYIRNHRFREKVYQYEINSNQLNDSNHHIFFIDLLDTIHCHLIHSYDVGYRTNTNHLKTVNKDDDTTNDNVLDDDLNRIGRQLLNKRKALPNIDDDRSIHSKYSTSLNVDIQTDNINMIQYAHQETSHFSFGVRYYYWDYYKDNTEHDYLCNPGYCYYQWFIHPKYINLKNEILSNKLDVKKYRNSLCKAAQYMKCSIIKELKADNLSKYWLKYGVNKDEALSVEHLLSVIFYTDYSELSYLFSVTFRKTNTNESDESL